MTADAREELVTVVIPEFVTHWRQQWLHNQSALALKARLLYRPNTVVTSIPVIVDEVDSEGEWRGTETVAYDIRDAPD